MSEAQVLLATAATVAVVHTVLGPDHYLVFSAMGRARGWGLARTLRITLYCGIGHVLGSVALGAIGIIAGAQLAQLVHIESLRGNLAGWALIAFGLVYLAWGLKRAGRGRRHSHLHVHGDVVHEHTHTHEHDHAHVHESGARNSITPWAMFVIFVLGPCEALIPLLMYPAARQSGALVISVALVFSVITIMHDHAGLRDRHHGRPRAYPPAGWRAIRPGGGWSARPRLRHRRQPSRHLRRGM